MHGNFEIFTASKQLIDLQDRSEAVETVREAFDLSAIHSEQVLCYYAVSGRPVAHLEVIRGPGRDEPSYHLKRGVWDELAIGSDELRRLEKILYECLEDESS